MFLWNVFTRLIVILCILSTIIGLNEVSAVKTLRKQKLHLRRVVKKPQGNVKLKASFIIGKRNNKELYKVHKIIVKSELLNYSAAET